MPQIIASMYEIIREIGSGGGGVVYLARHLRLDKFVVLKADKRTLTTKEETLRREVNALKGLSHTYIPQVYDFVQEDGVVYTVMDYIEGESLDKPLQRGEQFDQKQIIEWACELLEALCYLHSRPPYGILHSDIKPANIMLTPQGDIRLIDFNIALALGEEGAVRVGRSLGYASPEHYGKDFTGGHATGTGSDEKTETVDSRLLSTPVRTTSKRGSLISKTSGGGSILLDVRSDIYSLGATLYHLLTGVRPPRDPADVKPIASFADRQISPPVARIVAKAMSRNPDDRYQTASDMLDAFRRLRRDDPRARRHRRRILESVILFTVILLVGGALMYIGLWQKERLNYYSMLAGQSESAFQSGDVDGAVDLALAALPERGFLDPPYTTEPQRALANALGVYDLTDGYKAHCSVPLPGAPIKVCLTPNGSVAAVQVDDQVLLFDVETGKQMVSMAMNPSPLSGFVFRDDQTLLYAGAEGLTLYDFMHDQTIWTADEPVTGVSLSADGMRAAAVYKDSDYAMIYRADTGEVEQTVSFQGKRQRVVVNDVYADPQDQLFALSDSGRWLAVSFADGSVNLYDLQSGDTIPLMEELESPYTIFEGGYTDRFFVFSANRSNGQSIFRMYDLEARQFLSAPLTRTTPLHAQADESGAYLSTETLMVRMDLARETQQEMAYTTSDIVSYVRSPQQTLVQTQEGSCLLFDQNAILIEDLTRSEPIHFAVMAGDFILLANRDEADFQILRSARHSEAQLFQYNSAYDHAEARVHSDRTTALLFRLGSFQIVGTEGELIASVTLPDAAQIYDQQYRRNGGEEYLEVTYYDGTVQCWSAKTGKLLSTNAIPAPEQVDYDTFPTDSFWVRAELGKPAEIYDAAGTTLIKTQPVDGVVTYVTQIGENLIMQYTSASGGRSAFYLDSSGEILADMPGLTDILPDETLIFDDNIGNLRQSKLYSLSDMMQIAYAFKEARA